MERQYVATQSRHSMGQSKTFDLLGKGRDVGKDAMLIERRQTHTFRLFRFRRYVKRLSLVHLLKERILYRYIYTWYIYTWYIYIPGIYGASKNAIDEATWGTNAKCSLQITWMMEEIQIVVERQCVATQNHMILANPKRLTFGGKVETSGRTPGA